MREIGSEFWEIPLGRKRNTLFPLSTQWFVSGRSALRTIIKELKPSGSVALPSWCCESMIKPFVDAGFEINFYSYMSNRAYAKDIISACDAVLIMDYFGYTNNEEFDLSFFKGTVIRDVTHSVFSNTYTDADYYFGSMRKWCGFWTGGYAWADDNHTLFAGQVSAESQKYISLREKAMSIKKKYLVSQASDLKQCFLTLFADAENILDHIDIAPAAERDVLAANLIDVDFIMTKRSANAKILRDAFKDCIIFSVMKENDCPMFVPIRVQGGKQAELQRFLIQKGIFCPIHWPISAYHCFREQERSIYDNELSLVCDQRYDLEDMNRIIKTIQLFMEEK